MMNPIIPVPDENKDDRQAIPFNKIPGVEENKSLTAIFESIMDLIIISDHRDERMESQYREESEPTVYDDDIVGCAVPLEADRPWKKSVFYVDNDLRIVQPTLAV